jgi:hypothetical protein
MVELKYYRELEQHVTDDNCSVGVAEKDASASVVCGYAVEKFAMKVVVQSQGQLLCKQGDQSWYGPLRVVFASDDDCHSVIWSVARANGSLQAESQDLVNSLYALVECIRKKQARGDGIWSLLPAISQQEKICLLVSPAIMDVVAPHGLGKNVSIVLLEA